MHTLRTRLCTRPLAQEHYSVCKEKASNVKAANDSLRNA
jgi:hypothetical protein